LEKRSSFRLWVGFSCSDESQIIEECEEFKKFHPELDCGYIID